MRPEPAGLELSDLITAHKRLQGAGGTLIVEDPTPEVLRLFEVTRLRNFFRFHTAASRSPRPLRARNPKVDAAHIGGRVPENREDTALANAAPS